MQSISETNTTKSDIDDTGKMKRKVMLRKLTKITNFHVSTQTIETAANLTPIHPANWVKDFKTLSLEPGYPTDSNPRTLAQPFIGFIRKNEKIYARENGLMRIALREFKRIYDQIQTEIENILQHHQQLLHAIVSEKLNHVLFKMQDNNWLFDPSYFVQKVSMNPLEDPIDAATQTRIISSYMTAQNEVVKKLESSSSSSSNKELKEVHIELGRLLEDLNTRRKSSGGWRSILYNTDGSMNLEMDLEGFDSKEKIEILQEKLKYFQIKSADKERQQNATIKMQQDVIFELKHEINNKNPSSNNTQVLHAADNINSENNLVKKTHISKLKKTLSPSISPSPSTLDNADESHSRSVVVAACSTDHPDITTQHVHSTFSAYENSLRMVLSTLHMVYSTLIEKSKQLEEYMLSNKYDKNRNIITVDEENSFYSSSSAAILDSYREDTITKIPLSSSNRAINASNSSKMDIQLINSLEKKTSNTSKLMNREYIPVLADNSKRPRPLSSTRSSSNVPLLRITKSLDAPIGYKHLLVRPQTAVAATNLISSLDKSKGFASIMSKSMAGNKPPLDAYRLLEAQYRQDKAKQQIAVTNNHQQNNTNKFQGGLLPNNTCTTYDITKTNKSLQASVPPRDILARTFSGPDVTIPEIGTRIPANRLEVNEEMSINSLEELDKSLNELDKNTSYKDIIDTKSYISYSLIREVSEMCQRLIDDFALSSTSSDVALNNTIIIIPPNNQLPSSYSEERPQTIGIGESLLDQETNSQYSDSSNNPHHNTTTTNHNKYGSVYENLFANINFNSKEKYTSASDVSNYVTITKDKLDHYKKEVSKLESILKSIGSNNKNNSTSSINNNDVSKYQINHQFSNVQELANTHYTNHNIYRPQSATTTTPIIVHAIQTNHPPRARTATNPTRKLKQHLDDYDINTNNNNNNNNSAISFNDSRYSEDGCNLGIHRLNSRGDDEIDQQMSIELSNLSEYEVV